MMLSEYLDMRAREKREQASKLRESLLTSQALAAESAAAAYEDSSKRVRGLLKREGPARLPDGLPRTAEEYLEGILRRTRSKSS